MQDCYHGLWEVCAIASNTPFSASRASMAAVMIGASLRKRIERFGYVMSIARASFPIIPTFQYLSIWVRPLATADTRLQ